MGVELDHADLSEKVLKFNFTNEGGVDGTYRLLKNISGLWLVQLCRRAFESRGGKWDYSKLVQLAAKETPLRSLIDPDDASFVNPTDMPNAIRFFCRKTGQAEPDSEGALIRCILESLALKYQQTLTCLEEITGVASDSDPHRRSPKRFENFLLNPNSQRCYCQPMFMHAAQLKQPFLVVWLAPGSSLRRRARFVKSEK